MRKFKLFLLGSILSILSIGSFTNASDDFVFNFSNYDAFSFPMNVSEYNVSFTNVGELCDLSLANKNLTNYCSIAYNGGNVSNGCSSLEMSGPFYPRYNGYCQGGYIKFTLKPYSISKDLPLVSTSLIDVVHQIIPYVIYIGIGLLLVTLGFYAIRWLVNWLGRKINSIFRSKRN